MSKDLQRTESYVYYCLLLPFNTHIESNYYTMGFGFLIHLWIFVHSHVPTYAFAGYNLFKHQFIKVTFTELKESRSICFPRDCAPIILGPPEEEEAAVWLV